MTHPPHLSDPLAPPVAELRNVLRQFGDKPALNDVSLTLQRGEILGLIGRSGAGKSTLIRCLNGLDRPQSGQVIIDGQDLAPLSERGLAPVRRRIGMIFQHFNLLSSRTVAENVALPLKIAGVPRPERARRVAELLDLVGLADKADAYPARLSGGQKQRVGIARALAPEPLLLLSDEATSALDPETTHSILELLARLNRQLGVTILLITHEMEVVRSIAHRVLVLDQGRIVEAGDVAQVLLQPNHPTTQSLTRGLVPSLPDDLASVLRAEAAAGYQALVQIDLWAQAARAPYLALAQTPGAAPPRLLHGGLAQTQGQPVGRVFLGLGTLDADAVAATVARLEQISLQPKVLGYVPDAV